MKYSKFISRKEAAAMLDVHPQTITNYAAKGLIKIRRTSKGHHNFRFSRADVETLASQLEDIVTIETRIDRYKAMLQTQVDELERKISITKGLMDEMDEEYKTMGSCSASMFRALFSLYLPPLSEFSEELTILDAAMKYGVKGAAYRYRKSRGEVIQSLNAVRRAILDQPTIASLKKQNASIVAEHPVQRDEDMADMCVSDDVLDMKVADLSISVRLRNCLEAAEVHTVRDILDHTRLDLLRYRNFGRVTLRELESLLANMGLQLKRPF